MGLLDEARAQVAGLGARCTVGILLQSLGPGERAELDEALADSVQSTALARALRNRGHTVSADTIQRHRRGQCRCQA